MHQFGTPNLVVDCYDNSSPPQRVEPDKIQISPATYNVTVNFSTRAQTGYCVVNGAGTAAVGAGGSGGAVSSVFGRAGAVLAQTGDYACWTNHPAVSASSQLPGAGGDLNGTLTAATVTGIPKPRRGRHHAGERPEKSAVECLGASAWQPGTVSGSGAVSSVFGQNWRGNGADGRLQLWSNIGPLGPSQFPAAGGDFPSGTSTAATVTGIPKPGRVEYGSRERPDAGMEIRGRVRLAAGNCIGGRRGNQRVRQNRHRNGADRGLRIADLGLAILQPTARRRR